MITEKPRFGKIAPSGKGAMQMQQTGIILGFDYGRVRIGVALGNILTAGARPLCIVNAQTKASKWGEISKQINDWKPDCLVIGIPRHPDGTPHEVTQEALRFARQLAGRTGLAVYGVDERYSSVLLEKEGEAIDDQSAATILQQWFEEGCPKNEVGRKQGK